ncbi:MAG: hypothetical protein IIB00_10145, partial [candidate division Zixibacteria bacterium]|nr:hypothetical protein [candidate division Zixibacteria bacterium]
TFYATDDSAAVDSEVVTITVNEVGNQLPVLAAIGAKSTNENVNLNFSVSATDVESTPTLTTSALPGGATFTPSAGGGTFDWTPSFIQAGVFSVTFYATDAALAVDSEVVTITVTDINRAPIAVAGVDQINISAGTLVTLDGSGSFDPDVDSIVHSWNQVSGVAVILANSATAFPSFTPIFVGNYIFSLTVNDGSVASTPDSVTISVISGAPPVAVSDLRIQIIGSSIQLNWSAVTLDTKGLTSIVNRYVIYRGTSAYFTPSTLDSIGWTDSLNLSFVDNNIGGVNVVGDTLTQYFYALRVVDFLENASGVSNRVGEYDYALTITSTTDFNLIGIPFTNTGILNADGIIAAIGAINVNTVNIFIASSQSYQARFAAGFGTNFTVNAGGVYQVNSAANATFSVAGNVPATGTINYPIITTETTDFNFLMVPFELELSILTAQNVIDNIPGVLNTLNNFISSSQSYESRFAIGFGTNFTVKAGKPYQANASSAGTFPGP